MGLVQRVFLTVSAR